MRYLILVLAALLITACANARTTVAEWIAPDKVVQLEAQLAEIQADADKLLTTAQGNVDAAKATLSSSLERLEQRFTAARAAVSLTDALDAINRLRTALGLSAMPLEHYAGRPDPLCTPPVLPPRCIVELPRVALVSA